MYVLLDLFVHQAQQRQSSTSPWKLTQSIKLRTEESIGSELRSTAANHLFDGRRSERERQVQAN